MSGYRKGALGRLELALQPPHCLLSQTIHQVIARGASGKEESGVLLLSRILK